MASKLGVVAKIFPLKGAKVFEGTLKKYR